VFSAQAEIEDGRAGGLDPPRVQAVGAQAGVPPIGFVRIVSAGHQSILM
jgi:hypothetical protein